MLTVAKYAMVVFKCVHASIHVIVSVCKYDRSKSL